MRQDFTDLPTVSKECNALLGLPRIALLFLSRGRMYHEDAWTAWLAGVRGLLPKQFLQVQMAEHGSCSLQAVKASECRAPAMRGGWERGGRHAGSHSVSAIHAEIRRRLLG